MEESAGAKPTSAINPAAEARVKLRARMPVTANGASVAENAVRTYLQISIVIASLGRSRAAPTPGPPGRQARRSDPVLSTLRDTARLEAVS